MGQIKRISRREFVCQSATLAGAFLLGPTLGPLAAQTTDSLEDWVPLGRKAGITIPRLGFGTGSNGGRVQRNLGQEEFNRLIRYAFDRGVRYIDTADNYRTHTMVREAIRGLPREKLFIQSKMPIRPDTAGNPLGAIDRYRSELGVDTIDSLLIHCVVKPTWPDDLKPMMEGFDEARHRGWIKAKGVSCHGLPALRAATTTDWIEVQLARINPQGRYVDGDNPALMAPEGNVTEAMKEIRASYAKGRGIIGMKLIGNGDFTNPEDREKAMQHAMTCGCVDAVVIGFGSAAEVDEAIQRMRRALDARRRAA